MRLTITVIKHILFTTPLYMLSCVCVGSLYDRTPKTYHSRIVVRVTYLCSHWSLLTHISTRLLYCTVVSTRFACVYIPLRRLFFSTFYDTCYTLHATTLLQTLTIVSTLHANYLSLLKCKSLCSLLQPEVSPHVANVVLALEDK